jgi:steroid 5-alpha reductase family enzyme
MDNAAGKSYLSVLVIVLVAVGVSLAGSQGGYAAAGVPVFAIGVALAFVINWIVFIHAYLNRTEKFFDLTGGITFISVVLTAVFLSSETDGRSWLLVGMVIIWAARLSSFLFMRIRNAGEDRRFRELKQSFPRFLVTWTLQGLWVSLSLAAALVAITSQTRKPLGAFALIGILVWLLGFGIEVIADRQKSAFKAIPENAGKFIHTGLWSWSRHPNYFGEIVLWIGVAIVALPILQGWGWLMLISPVFITLLLTKVSGVPMLEKRADEKWGGQTDYETYKARTSVLILRPPANGK